MLSEERIAVLVFLSLITAVYIFAFGELVRIVLRKFAGRRGPQTRLYLWFRYIVFGLALTGFLCFAYGYFIEPYRLTVRKFELRTDKLSKGSDPIRIVHISDLHSDSTPRLEERLPEAIAEQEPDLIVFTGDSINSPEGLPVFKRCIEKIAKIAPTYVVKGNWDSWYWRSLDLFGNTGVTELSASTEKVTVRRTEIWISGVPVGKEEKIGEILAAVPKDNFSVFLYHYPDEIEAVAKEDVDLYCAGHTHGGQIALPVYGALVTLSKYGKRFEGGSYKVGNTWLNVNRGIGMEGGIAPRVRFWAVPEITLIEVVPN